MKGPICFWTLLIGPDPTAIVGRNAGFRVDHEDRAHGVHLVVGRVHHAVEVGHLPVRGRRGSGSSARIPAWSGCLRPRRVGLDRVDGGRHRLRDRARRERGRGRACLRRNAGHAAGRRLVVRGGDRPRGRGQAGRSGRLGAPGDRRRHAGRLDGRAPAAPHPACAAGRRPPPRHSGGADPVGHQRRAADARGPPRRDRRARAGSAAGAPGGDGRGARGHPAQTASLVHARSADVAGAAKAQPREGLLRQR